MEQVYVEMLSTFKTYEEGEKYQIDKATAEKWEAADLCKIVEDPSEKLVKAFETKINAAIEKVADKIKVETKAPAQPKDNSDQSIGDFLFLVAKNDRQKLANKYGEKVLSLSGDSALVPTPLANELLYSAGFDESLLSRVRRIDMPSDTYKFPVLDQAGTSPSGGSSAYYGGVVGGFDAETDDANSTAPAWTSVTLNAIRYTAYTLATMEIRQDSVVALDTYIPQTFSEAFNNHMSYYILNGGGTTEPVGLIDHAATVAVNRNTASNIKFADVVNMYSRKASGGNGWFWVISNSALPQLLNLQDGAGRLVYSVSARDNIASTLLGHPVVVSQHASTLGSAGDLMLINGNGCGIFGTRGGVEISFSDHVQFLKSQRAYKLITRVDFRPIHASTITLADGTTTVGEAIQLDDVSS